MPRHEEHVQNIRRFHESLHQAEGNTHRAGQLDSLSHSSRTSLLGALRKNLNELDEIQRYFNQKLNRSFPDLGAPSRKMDERSASRQSLFSKAVDPEGRHLLEKSSHLVSQVSGLINDLQNNMCYAEDSSGTHEAGSRCSSAHVAHQGVLDQKDEVARAEMPEDDLRNKPSITCVDKEPVLPPGHTPCRRGMLYDFLGQANSQSDPLLSARDSQREEEAIQSFSEEEYEEDVIEPRTLNEITTMTDKTSPWSSLLSDPERDPDQGAPKSVEQLARAAEHFPEAGSVGSNSLSDVAQDEPQSRSSTAGSSSSPFREEGSDQYAGGQDLEEGAEELFRAVPDSMVDQASDSLLEDQRTDQGGVPGIQKEVGGKPCMLSGGGDFAPPPETKAVVPEMEEQCGSLSGIAHVEEGINRNEEGHQRCFRLSEATEHTRSCSDESRGDPPEESDKSLKPSVVLSDPIVVPNFFLPPQHLEASMRLLSLSPAPLAAASKTGGDASAGGIPYRRSARPKPSLTPAELPEEETKRIARIFSAQFSKKE